MKFTLSLAVAAASVFSTTAAFNNLYARSFYDDVDIYAREAESFDDEYDLFGRDLDSLDDGELYLAARDLVHELKARAGGSRSSSSSSTSGLFAAPLGSGGGQPHSPAGWSPTSPTLNDPHFVRTGAYTLDANGGRRHSTGSSTAFSSGGGGGGGGSRRHSIRR